MAHDYLFSEKRDEIRDFDFGKDTAVVFDDMLDRSVDGWATMLSRIPFSLGLSLALTLGYLVLLRLKRSKSLITNLLTLRTNNW